VVDRLKKTESIQSSRLPQEAIPSCYSKAQSSCKDLEAPGLASLAADLMFPLYIAVQKSFREDER
jgi:hypothetical protein